jgi:hypothetical protein
VGAGRRRAVEWAVEKLPFSCRAVPCRAASTTAARLLGLRRRFRERRRDGVAPHCVSLSLSQNLLGEGHYFIYSMPQNGKFVLFWLPNQTPLIKI